MPRHVEKGREATLIEKQSFKDIRACPRAIKGFKIFFFDLKAINAVGYQSNGEAMGFAGFYGSSILMP